VKDQAIIRNILVAAETLAKRRVPLILKWIPGHARINGNEIADQKAKLSASVIGPVESPVIRYLSAIRGLIRQHTVTQWNQRWSQGSKGSHTRRLNAEPSRATRRLHSGREKAYSAVLTQLRTGKIGFNAFLHERKVPTVLSPRCPCGTGVMTVQHILLACPDWKDLRSEYIRPLGTTDLSSILNSPKGCTAAITLVIRSKLLEQFKGVVCNSLATPQRDIYEVTNLITENREP
jgi:hypothetical protein